MNTIIITLLDYFFIDPERAFSNHALIHDNSSIDRMDLKDVILQITAEKDYHVTKGSSYIVVLADLVNAA